MIAQGVRRLILPAFRQVNLGDITISHHWTGDALRLHSFRHKGYWWYGRGRERQNMELFCKLVRRGSTVIEIGGHIGYVAQYFSMLTGPQGRVFCFEPSPENLRYLRVNAAQSSRENICIVEAAVGERDEMAPFFFETITGQNCTVVSDFSGFEVNSSYNGLPADYQTCTVSMRRLDSFVTEHSIRPEFVKIDAEGGELGILSGMPQTLAAGPRLMVEINTHREQVLAILAGAKYRVFDASAQDSANVFAIHADDRQGMEIMEQLR